MPLLTNGFLDDVLLAEHFDTHVTQQQEFDVDTQEEYLELADKFLGAPLDPTTTHERRRRHKAGGFGDTVRYNFVTEEFGIITRDGYIRTFFIPEPCGPPRGHSEGTNLDYFLKACRKVNY